MKLTIKERLIIQNILIKQGGLIEMTLVKSILKKTGMTVDEIRQLEMKDTPNGVQWNPRKETEPKEFDFTADEIGVLKKSVQQADEEKRIHLDTLDFCQRIMTL